MGLDNPHSISELISHTSHKNLYTSSFSEKQSTLLQNAFVTTIKPSPAISTAIGPSLALEVNEYEESTVFKNLEPLDLCLECSAEM